MPQTIDQLLTQLQTASATLALASKGLSNPPAQDDLQNVFVSARKLVAVIRNTAKAAGITLVEPTPPVKPAS